MIEAMKQALEALEDVGVLTDREWQAVHKNKANELRQAIREHAMYEVQRLGQEIEQEPVAWADHGVVNWIADKQFNHASLLYTHPPQRTWVGLTDEEQQQAYEQWQNEGWGVFYRAIEAKLKELNT